MDKLEFTKFDTINGFMNKNFPNFMQWLEHEASGKYILRDIVAYETSDGQDVVSCEMSPNLFLEVLKSIDSKKQEDRV